MKNTKVTCDACSKDLSDSGGFAKYRLKLSCEVIPNLSEITYAMKFQPPLDRDHHFCGRMCLKVWMRGEEQENKCESNM